MDRRLKVLRARLGLTQAQFAKSFGVRSADVHHWELGVRPPNKYIAAICKKTRISEKWLRTGEGEMGEPKTPGPYRPRKKKANGGDKNENR
jgi:transcriptional regulator with XRE-family HTH domain